MAQNFANIDTEAEPQTMYQAGQIIGALKERLNQAVETAEKYEFIELVREKMEISEENLSDGFTDNDYEQALRHKYPNETYPKELKKFNKHYRRWIWILHFGDEAVDPQTGRLRSFLNKNRAEYHRFAKNMQSFYGLLSKNIHTSVFNVKYVKKEKLCIYLQYIGEDLRGDVTYLLRSENKPKPATSASL